MAKKNNRHTARGANGFVTIRISSEAYKVAQARVGELQEQFTKQNGFTVKLRPSAVIEKMLLDA